jgi:hypothetical protein
MRVVKLVSMIGKASFGPSQAIEFFTTVLKNRERLGAEASLCLDVDIAEMQLKLGQLQEVKLFIEDTRDALLKTNYAEAVAYSKFYKMMAEYHKVSWRECQKRFNLTLF